MNHQTKVKIFYSTTRKEIIPLWKNLDDAEIYIFYSVKDEIGMGNIKNYGIFDNGN